MCATLWFWHNRVDYLLRDMTNDEWGIIMDVHDELIIEAPREWLSKAPEILAEIRKEMIDFPEFDVPLEVEAQVSTSSWSRTEPFTIPC